MAENMLAEVAGPDQRAAKKMRPGHCTKNILLYIIVDRVKLNKLLQIITKLRWSNKDNNN